MQTSENGWVLTQNRFLMSAKTMVIDRAEISLTMAKGLIANRIELSDGNRLLFSRRHSQHLSALAQNLNVPEKITEPGSDLLTVV